MLFDALYAFFQEHQYCGELDAGVENDRPSGERAAHPIRARDHQLIEAGGNLPESAWGAVSERTDMYGDSFGYEICPTFG